MAKKKKIQDAEVITATITDEVTPEVTPEATPEATPEVAPEEPVETSSIKNEKTGKSGKKMPSLSEDLSAATKEVNSKKAISLGRVSAEGAESSKKFDKYNVVISDTCVVNEGSKIAMVVAILRHALQNGMSQSEINESKFVATFPLLREFPEGSSVQEIRDDLAQHKARYATKEDKHIVLNKTVMVVCNQWYPTNAEKFITAMSERFPEIKVDIV